MNPYTPHPLFDIIGSALLHFVWQGTLIAITLAVLLAFTKKAAPNFRYLISWLALVLMVGVPAYTIVSGIRSVSGIEFRVSGSYEVQGSTFNVQGLGEGEGSTVNGQGLEDVDEVAGLVGIGESPAEESVWGMIAWVRPYVVLFWLVGVLGMMGRLFVGCWWTHRLRGQWSVPVEGEMKEVFDRLIERAGIRREVLLRKTSEITEAVLIGWVKPAVLLPVSVVSEMSIQHIEAIIAHELAHVKRFDAFFAGVQAVIETLLFYHPAVWWVSRQVRIEREHCCDDLAVRILNDKILYARALFELENQRSGFGRFALSVQDGSLLARIRRIASMPEEKKKPYTVRPVMSSMIVIGLIGFSLVLGSCADFQVESDNPVSIGERYELPPRLESMVVVGDRDGIVTFLHDAHNSGEEETLKLITGVYDRGNEEIRRSLMFVLAHINTPEADQVLIQMAESDVSEDVRYGAMRSITVRIDEILEYHRFNEQPRRQITATSGGYEYPLMTFEQEQALTSGLERIALDNNQFTDVREEALIALAHREDAPRFMRKVIGDTQDEFIALKAAGYLTSVDEAAAEIMRVFYAASSTSVQAGALSKLGNIKATSAVPLLIEQSFEGSTEDAPVQTSKRDIRFGMPPYWTAQSSLRRIYAETPGGESILTAVEQELERRLSQIEREVERGQIVSATAREKVITDLVRMNTLTSIFRDWVALTNPLDPYKQRIKKLRSLVE